MSFLTKFEAFFNNIGLFFVGLFNAAQKAWNKLEKEIKDAMLKASGIVAIINENVTETPEFVFDLIQKQYPEFTKEKLLELIKKGTFGLSVGDKIIDADLLTTIKHLQTFLSGFDGAKWATISQDIMKGLAIVLAPQNTKFAIISQLAEFAYQRYVKKR